MSSCFLILQPFSSFGPVLQLVQIMCKIQSASDMTQPLQKHFPHVAKITRGPTKHPATGGTLCKQWFPVARWRRFDLAPTSLPTARWIFNQTVSLNHLHPRGDVTLPSCRGIADLCTATCCWGPERLLSPPLLSVCEETRDIFFFLPCSQKVRKLPMSTRVAIIKWTGSKSQPRQK